MGLRKHMNILIIGGGKIGYTLTKELSLQKQDVVVVEKEKDLADKIAQDLNAKVINGSATDRQILEEAGIKKADVIVITTEQDEVNLMIVLLAKEMGCHRIIARTNNADFKSLFLHSGANRVISPEHSVAEQLNAVITQPDIYDLAVLHEDVDLYQFEIDQKSELVSKAYHENLTPKDSLIIALRRATEFLIPNSETVFKAADKVIVIAKKEVIEKVKKIFQ